VALDSSIEGVVSPILVSKAPSSEYDYAAVVNCHYFWLTATHF